MMALNKSNKSTPSSRSGFLSDCTASAGKQTSFQFPVRIKVTPTHNNTLGPLSDKKNPTKMLQPVLIKDLLASTNKKNNSSLLSASTAKKKTKREAQPYLNTQSAYKPKKEENGEPSFFRKSYGGSKVRRQLYEALDSPQKVENKENINKTTKPKKKTTDISTKNTQDQNRKSMLLPPNSIKNSILRNSGSDFKAPASKPVKSSTTTLTKSRISRVAVPKTKAVKRKTQIQQEEELDSSSQSSLSYNTKDNSTMTSPIINKDERPTVIMSTSKISGSSKNISSIEPPCLEMEKLSLNKPQCNCTNTEFDFSKMNSLDPSSFMQFKFFLEQSIKACEDQASKLKQVLNFMNSMMTTSTSEKSEESPTGKCNVSIITLKSPNDSDATEIINKSSENQIMDSSATEIIDAKENVEDKLPIPIKVLVTDADMNPDSKEASLNELARLSTIGEVSCEVDESNNKTDETENKSDESENKENVSDLSSTKIYTPSSHRRRSVSCDPQCRRRSARLAAKRMSLNLSDSDKQDSFTQLENELNVEHKILPSKSLPASPMKAPTTPGVIKQWDKRVERPLREYMALKMNGTFLVTPDVKRFQSCLESTDTPHSRKSMSRKIFMELCDLYAESPEHK